MSSAESSVPCASEPHSNPAGSRAQKRLIRAVTVTGVVLLGLFVLLQAGKLWQEWRILRDELHESRQHAIVGYLNIAPVASFAEWPKDWYRVDGDKSFLWFNWERGSGHRWFRFGPGEIDPRRLQRPLYEFISQPIDFPVVEKTGGKIWRRIPSESLVVGCMIADRSCVYPVAVLVKVLAVNDVINEHPYLVVVNPLANPGVAFSVYDTLLEGHRVTLAPTGYFQDGKPVLYDRGTESLWIEMHDGLTSMAGKHFKKRLMRVGIVPPIAWGTWVNEHPETRLLVGANRSLGIPKE